MKEHFVVVVTTSRSLQESTRALATRLASRANAVLLFLHVVPFRRTDGEGMLYSAMEVAGGEADDWVRAQRPADAGVRFRHRIEAGEPEDVVARFVREHEVDLVVVEEPPRNWISETLWRGFAEQLIRRVACPVVVGGPGFLRSPEPAVPEVTAPFGGTTAAELLSAMVEARVEALRCWMDQAADAMRRIADSETVQTSVALASRSEGVLDRRAERRLMVELEEHRRAQRAVGWTLTVGQLTWGAARIASMAGRALPGFLARIRESGQSTSLPMAVGGASDALAVLSGATVADGTGVLLFEFDAGEDFLRILGQPGPLPSFETYAFDERGLMLSNSRFPEHLLAAGLLPAGTQTPLRLRVAEPSDGPSDGWPLTHMAQQAIGNRNGFNTQGYRDYRGTPVVGAWRWIPEYGFGVAAEVDRDAAFR